MITSNLILFCCLETTLFVCRRCQLAARDPPDFPMLSAAWFPEQGSKELFAEYMIRSSKLTPLAQLLTSSNSSGDKEYVLTCERSFC